ncbi:MAG: ROK family protein [Acidimicrobiia bacterium]|nr:ROK family protein [Acidimicrobiia bacterium]
MALIAVDCGGTNLAFGRYRPDGVGEPAGRRPAPPQADAIPAAIVEAITPLLDDAVEAVGIGVAGLVDHERGTLVWSPHASGERVALGAEVAAAVGRPVVVDNDANLAALAEALVGAGIGHRMVLFVGLGTGIGGGLVVEGHIERGRGFLGEVGHMVVDPSGPQCACGHHGCWEALVSGTTLGRAAAELVRRDPQGGVARAAGGAAPRGEHLAAAAAAGDPAALAELAAAGARLGRGLANLVAVLDPDVIVVGGAAAGAGEALLAPARALLAETVEGGRSRPATPVVAARWGTGAGLVGAALAAGGKG